jgi:RNA polymerase sigma-70 factor, ECF subfamily
LQNVVSRNFPADKDELELQGAPSSRPVRALDAETRQALLRAIPHLRAFAISLCGNLDQADDLVQETTLKALTHLDGFQPGTNLQAWMFTILRNLFHTGYRRRRREVEDADGLFAATLSVPPDQHARLDFEDLRGALAKLPPDQREALVLIGAEGFSYEETAAICGTKVGTIKSRVNRARTRLAELLHLQPDSDMAPDGLVHAALSKATSLRSSA